MAEKRPHRTRCGISRCQAALASPFRNPGAGSATGLGSGSAVLRSRLPGLPWTSLRLVGFGGRPLAMPAASETARNVINDFASGVAQNVAASSATTAPEVVAETIGGSEIVLPRPLPGSRSVELWDVSSASTA